MSLDQAKLYDQWKASQDPKVLADLMQTLKPTVANAVKTYANGNESLNTRAYILAREALDSYDPSKKASLSTHVFSRLQRLYRISSERFSAVHVPENVRTDSLSVQRFVNRFSDEHGIEPSDLQIADALKMSPKRVMKATTRGRETMESKATSDKGDTFGQSSGLSEEEVWRDYVYASETPENQKVMEYTMGYGNAKVIPKGVAAAKMGISAPAYSQRINTVTKKLNKLYDLPTDGPQI